MVKLKIEYYEIEVHFSNENMKIFNCVDPDEDFTFEGECDNSLTIKTMEGQEILLSLYNIDYVVTRKARQTVDRDTIGIPANNERI